MTEDALAGMRALVTGASSGLGADIARDLAARGAHVAVVARRRDRLEALATDIRVRHGVEVDVVEADLSSVSAAGDVYERVCELGRPIDILVNNAGLGFHGPDVTIPWESDRGVLLVNVVALAGLTKLFVGPMVERKRGFVLNVASTAAYQPTPLYASYAATKAFVLSYSEALNYELRGTGVSVTALSPGVTETEFFAVSGQSPNAFQRATMMRSSDVARAGIEAMLARKASVIPGPINAIGAVAARLSPRALTLRLAERLMR